jgi:hypothetical protein
MLALILLTISSTILCTLIDSIFTRRYDIYFDLVKFTRNLYILFVVHLLQYIQIDSISIDSMRVLVIIGPLAIVMYLLASIEPHDFKLWYILGLTVIVFMVRLTGIHIHSDHAVHLYIVLHVCDHYVECTDSIALNCVTEFVDVVMTIIILGNL